LTHSFTNSLAPSLTHSRTHSHTDGDRWYRGKELCMPSRLHALDITHRMAAVRLILWVLVFTCMLRHMHTHTHTCTHTHTHTHTERERESTYLLFPCKHSAVWMSMYLGLTQGIVRVQISLSNTGCAFSNMIPKQLANKLK